MRTKPKVIVIGLDGATWDIIKPWAEEGKLPTFKYLMENGAWGILESTIPPLSPSAWVSIYTGCKPSKHKIFGFVKRKEGSYFYRPISSRDIKKPVIWEILSNYNKKSVVINALFVYPPRKINGVLITGLGTPSLESNFVYPPSYKEFILTNFPKYDVDFDEDLLLVSNNAGDFIKKIEDVTIEQIRLTKHFLKNEEWDFMFSIFRALDVIQHYFWEDKGIVFKFYKIFDEFLSELIQEFNNDKNNRYVLFIVSDHGFGPVKKYFCVNNWLEQIGMLKFNKPQTRVPITAETIKKILLKLGMRNIVWKLKRSSLVEKLLKIIPSEELGHVNRIKWDKTKAYYYEGSDGIININRIGREPLGTVSEEEYNRIVKYITDKLNEVRDPETGETIVEKVYTKREIFNTEDKSIPDIYVLLKKGYRAVGYNKLDGKSIFMPPIHGKIHRPGDHYLEGIFVAYGDVILPQHLQRVIHLWDILPTVFQAMDLPIPTEIDGNVVNEIFTEEFIDKNKPKNIEIEKIKIKAIIRQKLRDIL